MFTPINTIVHTVAYLWKRWQRKGFRSNQTKVSTVLKHMRRAAA